MKIVPFIITLSPCASLFAGSIAVPSLPAPEYLDTEVSTFKVLSSTHGTKLIFQ